MNFSLVLIILLAASAVIFHWSKRRALRMAGNQIRALHSLPSYYGWYSVLWCFLPALLLLVIWVIIEPRVLMALTHSSLPEHWHTVSGVQLDLFTNELRNLIAGSTQTTDIERLTAVSNYQHYALIARSTVIAVLCGLFALGSLLAMRRISPQFRARNRVEFAIRGFLMLCSLLAVLTTLGIVLSVLFESILFFQKVPFFSFLFGLEWSPQTAIRPDQVGSSGAFGAVPLFLGTMMISLIAMAVAVPLGLLSAVYLSEYASTKVRSIVKPLLEVLAGIPTVVYGFFAALTVAPFLRSMGMSLGLDVASESALAAGLVMGIMIIPFVSSLSDDVINAVPQAMRDGAYALGATKSETVKQVILPAALPGIVGSVLLAISRAIGETMIVVMAAGLTAKLTANPLESMTTVTVQIVTLLVGDQEFDSPKTLAAFALGLILFIVTLILNVIALTVVRKYREQYE